MRSLSAVHLLLPWTAIVGLTAAVGLVLTFTHSLGDPIQDLASRLMTISEHGIALMLPYGIGLAIYHGVQHVSVRPGLHSRMRGSAIALFAVTPFAAAVGLSFYAQSLYDTDPAGARRLNAMCDPLMVISVVMVAAIAVVLLALNSEQEAKRSAGRGAGQGAGDPWDHVSK